MLHDTLFLTSLNLFAQEYASVTGVHNLGDIFSINGKNILLSQSMEILEEFVLTKTLICVPVFVFNTDRLMHVEPGFCEPFVVKSCNDSFFDLSS